VIPFRRLYLEHHLSEPTRAARRNLLLLSVVAYLLVKGQLVPEKIEFLGLTIGALQEATLFKALLALLIYYLAKFYLYMFTDGEIHMYKAYESVLKAERIKTWKEYRAAVDAKGKEIFSQVGWWGLTLMLARLAIDNIFPVVAGGYAILLVTPNAL